MLEVIISTLLTVALILIYDYLRVYKLTLRIEEELDRIEADLTKIKVDMERHVANFKGEFRKIQL
jgi:cell division protein FtsL